MKKSYLMFVVVGIISTVMLSTTTVYGQDTPDTGAEPPVPLIGEFLIEENMKMNETSNQTTMMKGENSTEHVPKFFAIQHAQSGSISEINETAYSLELNDVSDKTILFSDRPDRIVMSVSTANYIGNWTAGVDSFAVDGPNAVLVVDEMK